MAAIEIVLAFADSGLDAEELQDSVQGIVPQLREVEGIDHAGLLTVEASPDGAKAGGGIVPGAIQFLVENSKILQGVGWVGDRLINGKTLKLKTKAANGSEMEVEAKSREDFDHAVQQAIAFCEQNR
jgi:hypothetical protein